jgi:hypothetical protein
MSLSAEVREKINEVVTEFIRAGKMFTAFEVSLEVKKRGGEERHRNMREYVHETIFRLGIERGDYSRTLMDVGAPEQAWVYHTIASNPYDYVPLDRSGMDVVPAHSRPRGVRNPLRLTPGLANPFAIPTGAYGTDQRGRLCVPVSLLTQLGVGPGEQVNVLCDPANEQALITKATGATSGNPDTHYTVEGDGNVRITQGTLEKAGLDGMQCYKVEGNDAVISVRKYS